MKRWTWLALIALGLTGCPKDEDGDGYDDKEDCDDSDPYAYPGAEELCDGVDNDCDDEIDEEAVDAVTWYADTDADEYGDAAVPMDSCDAPEGYVQDDSDCDDADATVFPDAEEVCDDLDNDCDGEVDEGLAATWYADADSDGYGDPDTSMVACDPDPTYVENDEDCDDTDPDINPDGTEVCDGADNDCDGTTDIGVDGAPTWYADADGDGLGDIDTSTTACDQPVDYVDNGDDCNDGFEFITVCDTIYDVQDGTLGEDEAVVLSSVVVTGVDDNGFFAQEWDSGEYSAVWVYTGYDVTDGMLVGDEVALSGTTTEYYDLTEIMWDDRSDFLETLSTGNAVPAAEVLATSVFSDSATTEPWEGVLIQVQNVEVTDEDAGYGEFIVDSVLKVDEMLYDASDDFTITDGKTFTSITGPLNYTYDWFKIAPRSAADLVE